ncbi:MAG: deoxyhypusine synthase family protein [Ferruginibacter sp.]
MQPGFFVLVYLPAGRQVRQRSFAGPHICASNRIPAPVGKLNNVKQYKSATPLKLNQNPSAKYPKKITFAPQTIIMSKGPVSNFIEHHYRHFNAAALMDAAKGYVTHLDEGGKMMITLAGAMSTAELGLSLAEMIRQDKVAIISCTGANLEEDIMNLVAHSHYKRVPNYRDLSPQEEWDLLENHYNRVTDTCIPEEEAFRRLQQHIHKIWKDADDKGERYFPHEYMYKMLLSGVLEQYYEIDPKNSWMLAAAKKGIPIVCPGWEDSTMGNIFASYIIKNEMKATTMKSGIEYMVWLADWYRNNSSGKGVGFFQIGGGIAGDFPICVVPMMYQDLEWHDVPFWSYFCQISDSTTSYGSYSGAVPNEKITWGKLDINTPKFIVESDATIVAPLIFAWVLGW